MWSPLLIIHLKSLYCPGKYRSGGSGTAWIPGAADLSSSVIDANTDVLTLRSYTCCLCSVACFLLGFDIFPCGKFLSWITDALGTTLLSAIFAFLMCGVFFLPTHCHFFSAVRTRAIQLHHITAVLVGSYTLEMANGL